MTQTKHTPTSLSRVYPDAALLKIGTRLVHVDHGVGRVSKKTRKKDLPYTVWLRMEADNIEGTCDIRLCRWPE